LAHILIIDDDSQVLEMLKQTFFRANYDVDTATDGNKAMVINQQNPADVVITDLIMPDKEGMEVIREFRRNFPKTKIIAISGGGRYSGPIDYLDLAHKLGAARVFSKPFERKDILQAVKELLKEE